MRRLQVWHNFFFKGYELCLEGQDYFCEKCYSHNFSQQILNDKLLLMNKKIEICYEIIVGIKLLYFIWTQIIEILKKRCSIYIYIYIYSCRVNKKCY